MDTSTVIWLFILFVFLAALALLAWWVYNSSKPLKGNCSEVKKRFPDQKWSTNCQHIEEISLDSNLKAPTQPLYITDFRNVDGLGSPWGGIYVWYRYRYVDAKTGGYSDLSPWTSSPITAGSATLPCKSGSSCLSPKDTCDANMPQLGVDSLAYSISKDVYANVHRYASSNATPPDVNTSDEIVGYMQPSGSDGSYMFVDASESPCKKFNCGYGKGC